MSYRTIIVDGVQYHYTIGKLFLKFRGGPLVCKRDIGLPIDREYLITPTTIAEYIRTGKVDLGPKYCQCIRPWYESEDVINHRCANIGKVKS